MKTLRTCFYGVASLLPLSLWAADVSADSGSAAFLQDLAIVMTVAGLVTLLFHRLKQPVVLGYLLAGFIIGPYTPPFPLVKDLATIQTLADLGVVFLMFSLGIEFSVRKLRQVGGTAVWIGVVEISVMIATGFLLGFGLGWSTWDSVMLGLLLSLTSTMIVVKSLRDRDELQTRHAVLISGVSIFDDLFVILLLVALPGIARTGNLPAGEIAWLFTGLMIFLIGAYFLGLLGVPRLLGAIARHANEETMLIVSLSLCFGVSLIALRLGFSAALGAFLIGSVVAESRYAAKITGLLVPLRDMFCAVFFVAIGMQIAPGFLWMYLPQALLITGVYFVAKVLSCAGSAFLAGESAATSIRVGTNMAQLGEFAFLLATIGFRLGLSSEFLYPLIVAVASLNALLRPYLVENADALAHGIGRCLPPRLKRFLIAMPLQIKATHATPRPRRKAALRLVTNLGLQITVGVALIAGGFLVGSYGVMHFPEGFAFISADWRTRLFPLLWLLLAVLMLPLYVGTGRKMQAMSMLLSEIIVEEDRTRAQRALRRILQAVCMALQSLALLLTTVVSSASILPPWQGLLMALSLITLLLLRHGRAFNRWYSEAKFAVVAVLNEPLPPAARPETAPLPTALHQAHLQTVVLVDDGEPARLIREWNLRHRTGASIVAIERGAKSILNPGPDEELLPGDHILLLGSEEQSAKAAALLTRSD